MTKKITFNELRDIKDHLPHGSHYEKGTSVGMHIEQGPQGGIILLDDTTILEKAQEILEKK